MYRRFLVMIIILLTACTPYDTSTTPAETESPGVSEEVVTQVPEVEATQEITTEVVTPQDPYEEIPPDLCPPDIEPEEQPVFGEITQEDFEGEIVNLVFVQRGLFVNEQGELFRIDVIGATEGAVLAYTNDVRVCLDQIFTGKTTEPSGTETPEPDQLPDVFGGNEEDLSIEIYLLGFIDATEKEEIIMPLLEETPQNWLDWLEEMGLSPDQSRSEEFQQDFVIDFVIDPQVSNGGTHHYPERYATRAATFVSVQYGSGSVKAALCRYSVIKASTTVTKGGIPESNWLEHSGTYSGRYDLGVMGNSTGRYRLSGRSFWSGWSAGYYDQVPAGSMYTCNPP